MRYQIKCSQKKHKGKKNTGGKHKNQAIMLSNSKHQHTGIISAAKAANRTKKHSKNKQKYQQQKKTTLLSPVKK